jgi:hypothetical protein
VNNYEENSVVSLVTGNRKRIDCANTASKFVTSCSGLPVTALRASGKKRSKKIKLTAVSPDGLYLSTSVPSIFIKKSDRRPMCLPDFEQHFEPFPDNLYHADDREFLDHMCRVIKSHNPNMTPSEERFLDFYFGTLKALTLSDDWAAYQDAREPIGLGWMSGYDSPSDLWRALLPIPELQLYVQDPLAEKRSNQPDNNFRVDYGFWDGDKLIAVEIDGAAPEGYARDIRRDRLLRKAGVDVIHITNWEIETHKARALVKLLPKQFFGFDWNYRGLRPDIIPF